MIDLRPPCSMLRDFLCFLQLTLGNSNLQGTGENSSTYRKFELIDGFFKFNFVRKEKFIRVKVISSFDCKYTLQ